MPDSRFVQDEDVTLQELHFDEAFQMMSHPVFYLRFDKEATSEHINQVFDETDEDPKFDQPLQLGGVYDTKPKKEKIDRREGPREQVDAILWLSIPDLRKRNILDHLSNRDHFVFENVEYSVIEHDKEDAFDNRPMQMKILLREFKTPATMPDLV